MKLPENDTPLLLAPLEGLPMNGTPIERAINGYRNRAVVAGVTGFTSASVDLTERANAIEKLRLDLELKTEALEAAMVFITPLEALKFKGDEYKEDAMKRILAARANL